MNEYKPPKSLDRAEQTQQPEKITFVDAFARISICLFSLWALWMQSGTIYGHPYYYCSFGILNYYVYESGWEGETLRNEFRPIPLTFTIGLTILCLWFGYIGLKNASAV